MQLPDECAFLLPFVDVYAFVGSRVSCNPAPTDTDIDVLIKCKDQKALHRALCSGDWIWESDGYQGELDDPVSERSPFDSYRKGLLNLIATESDDFFCRFVVATQVSKKLNLMDKQQRILLFQAILYGNGFPETVDLDFVADPSTLDIRYCNL